MNGWQSSIVLSTKASRSRGSARRSEMVAIAAPAIAACGVFLTGLAAVVSSLSALHIQRRRSGDECAKRIKEIRKAFYEGMRLVQREAEEEEDRWSHLP